MPQREIYKSAKFYDGVMIPRVAHRKRAPLRELYELLVKNGYPTIALAEGLNGVCVIREDTEGGEYDEVLYITSSGLVLYGLIPYDAETPKAEPVLIHECPYYEDDEKKIIVRSRDGMNKLPAIELF